MKRLGDFTFARVGLERSGNALATREVLAFQLAHAMARDAVHHPFDAGALLLECQTRAWPVLVAHSAAGDRAEYLRRPDLGRRLAKGAILEADGDRDLAIVIADGLSALAVHRHAIPLLEGLIPLFDEGAWTRTPIVIVQQGRVAIGDEIGHRLRASMALMLIGERPGLSSPDSLGAYLTWNPVHGRTDAERNCISNIRPEGLRYENAAHRIFTLLNEARRRKLTGVRLKEGQGYPGKNPESFSLPSSNT